MTRITVLGGTGYAGSAVVAEAVSRGHEVTAVSRTAPEQPVEGATYVTASVLDDGVLEGLLAEADVVVQTLAPRGDMVGKLEGIMDRLIELAPQQGVRLAVLGGASSLRIEEGGPRLIDISEPPAEVRAEIQAGIDVLDALHKAPESVDWFYISPAGDFGAWVPGERTGSYRTSHEVLLKDEKGESHISAADLAIAFLDEIEQPKHQNRRFHVAY